MLLTGSPGLGKEQFAMSLAALMLCEAPKIIQGVPSACGACQGCHWLAGDNHPDFRRIAPENDEVDEGATKEKKKGARQIVISAIRALEDFVFVGSHRHGRRVVVINQADAMNQVAANSLLKILEEPPPSVYFIMVTSHPSRLLPTIRSRTRVVAFQRPGEGSARRWLEANGISRKASAMLALAAGAPLRLAAWEAEGQIIPIAGTHDSLACATDPLSLAAQWDSLLRKHPHFSLEMLVEEVQRWVHDISLTAVSQPSRFHASDSMRTDFKWSASRTCAAWREILRFRRSAGHTLNQQLFLEDLATCTMRAMQPARD
jgi:DNA polymerase-3 subunit delta'